MKSADIHNAPVLQAVGVSLRYPENSDYVLHNINLAVYEQEIVALLGESGCGKSSFINLASGLLESSEGYVAFCGQEIRTTPAKVAVVFQDACLLPWLTVYGNVAFALKLESLRVRADECKARVSAALRDVGLENAASKYPARLSGGMAQRVALARTLARRAELLLLDEPFSSLDAITRRSMQELLLDIIHKYRSSALIVTHDMDEALLIADRLILMTKENGETRLAEWNLRDILGKARGADSDNAQHYRRSSTFMDLKEEIAESLAYSTKAFGLSSKNTAHMKKQNFLVNLD
ncbi:MAG: nitrate/sulfonate/bicarbonate ABC transporter ATP-binding protein [Candidatus Desulfovibrio kirbyi]|uniref:Nitrate/sulfonate/bicarbonate ABC transporter ATP-binding protein n=1 Tax=Candidatus Desulfovibrio kirbyi TaxID=2696086 RepID=A0A6L2R6R6_9BACT|nr:MAG: nitrate/sulfonate/bicarbonate ABC transporter ATP-binding protein [Candidatus Desulfovibrio kirbyi]